MKNTLLLLVFIALFLISLFTYLPIHPYILICTALLSAIGIYVIGINIMIDLVKSIYSSTIKLIEKCRSKK